MKKREPYWKNSRIHIVLVLVTMVLIIVPALNKTPDQETAVKATDAAVRFLYLVDNGEYAQSWEIASEHLKATIGKEEWIEKLTEVRSSLGSVDERFKDDVTYLKATGDLPEGDYVVIRFDTNFSARRGGVETVTLHLGADGEWRVAGYF